MSCCYRESFFDNASNIQYFYFTIKILYFYFMYRKHFFYLLFLILSCLIVFGLEKFGVFNFGLSIFPLIITIFTLFTIGQHKKRKKQILFVKVISYLNIIYLLKYIIFDNTTVYGFIFLGSVTLLLAFALNSLKKDQKLVDSVNRLR